MESEIRGQVAVLWLAQPPVNALGHEMRLWLQNALTAAEADPGVRAIVLASRLKTFSAGADIREFEAGALPPLLPDLILQIEAGRKPVVAAIDGAALGGGLELALGCRARVLGPKARVGLPEVTLGLLPGAGGTQRLPPLTGLVRALDLIASGKPLDPKAALAAGVADLLAPSEELIEAGSALALRLAAGDALPRPAGIDAAGFEEAAAALMQSRGDDPAIAAIIDCLRAAAHLPLAEGLSREREAFNALRLHPRSKALRYAFFAERGTGGAGRPALPRQIGVIGGGTMGAGIAMAFAAKGFAVTLCETDEAAAGRARARVEESYAHSVARGSLSAAARDAQLAAIRFEGALTGLAAADLIIEAAFEDIAVKEQIFGQIAQIARPDAVLASNTSYLDIDRIAGFASGPERVAGMHFFSPANVMKLVEVVRGPRSSPAAIDLITATARAIGKLPVVVGNCHGFVGNRMLAQRTAQVEALLQEGALPEDLDAAFTAFGGKLGPCAVADLAGLDIGWRNRQATGQTAPVADALVEAGRLGQKTRRGYYRYGADGRRPEPDPEVAALIRDTSARLGITRRAIGQAELTDRLILPMINEGARILEEGIAASASDIDAIWLNGYGFPRWRGGPMFYADERGLAGIVAGLDHYAEQTGNARLRPCALLRGLAATGGRLTDPSRTLSGVTP
ncbi:3-hydroxyacyl-CoA dehydrogenase NAD-binding domain-containing protein [Falsigemmobacter faecalis]|uniref:3-hydroxyacyl-CoA dehydrogenase n=1 Tax=Falsigemmobacter faecalis TaxID=2488730 RepID=A0A3P3DDH2_9RHOB|nr:3-hydroxyacyl-CoA dehydrogenase NAD-binding domain-containing protein [Falsigemmobacter faecalis]RRH72377.1 3-hydroxyacyl-CoA dehydrogenase [Falsigemmobacter faecalis]